MTQYLIVNVHSGIVHDLYINTDVRPIVINWDYIGPDYPETINIVHRNGSISNARVYEPERSDLPRAVDTDVDDALRAAYALGTIAELPTLNRSTPCPANDDCMAAAAREYAEQFATALSLLQRKVTDPSLSFADRREAQEHLKMCRYHLSRLMDHFFQI